MHREGLKRAIRARRYFEKPKFAREAFEVRPLPVILMIRFASHPMGFIRAPSWRHLAHSSPHIFVYTYLSLISLYTTE